MTARVSQSSIQVLAEEHAKARVGQVVVQVLWGIGSSAQVSQLAALVLGRPPVRRTIAITD